MLACVSLCINGTEALKNSHNERLKNAGLLKDYQMICTVLSLISGDIMTSGILKADQLVVLTCKFTAHLGKVLPPHLTMKLLQRNVTI